MTWKGERQRHQMAARGIPSYYISNLPPKDFEFYPGYYNEYIGTVYEAYLGDYNMTIGKGPNIVNHSTKDDEWYVAVWDAEGNGEEEHHYQEFDTEEEAKKFATQVVEFYKEEGRMPSDEDLPEDEAYLHSIRY